MLTYRGFFRARCFVSRKDAAGLSVPRNDTTGGKPVVSLRRCAHLWQSFRRRRNYEDGKVSVCQLRKRWGEVPFTYFRILNALSFAFAKGFPRMLCIPGMTRRETRRVVNSFVFLSVEPRGSDDCIS